MALAARRVVTVTETEYDEAGRPSKQTVTSTEYENVREDAEEE